MVLGFGSMDSMILPLPKGLLENRNDILGSGLAHSQGLFERGYIRPLPHAEAYIEAAAY